MIPIETLREASRLMRERADAAAQPWRPWADPALPERTGAAAWSEDMDGYLGGSWGVHAASWHPAVALAVADWLDDAAEYAEHGRVGCERVIRPALAVARAYLEDAA